MSRIQAGEPLLAGDVVTIRNSKLWRVTGLPTNFLAICPVDCSEGRWVEPVYAGAYYEKGSKRQVDNRPNV